MHWLKDCCGNVYFVVLFLELSLSAIRHDLHRDKALITLQQDSNGRTTEPLWHHDRVLFVKPMLCMGDSFFEETRKTWRNFFCSIILWWPKNMMFSWQFQNIRIVRTKVLHPSDKPKSIRGSGEFRKSCLILQRPMHWKTAHWSFQKYSDREHVVFS